MGGDGEPSVRHGRLWGDSNGVPLEMAAKGNTLQIKSDFHDFYDCGQSFAHDDDVLYIRKTKVLKKNELKYEPIFPTFGANSYAWRPEGPHLIVNNYAVGFCGKIYPIFEIYNAETPNATKFCTKIEDFDAYIEANFKEKIVEQYRAKPDNWRHSNRAWRNGEFPNEQRRHKLEEYFEKTEAFRKSPSDEKAFDFYNVPIFIIQHKRYFPDERLILNPRLKDYEFFRIMDPYMAFQELQMYWSGKAHPAKPIPEMDDATKIEQHGLDPKWSFRKPPAS
jgi:hypothetical protein